MGIIKIKLNKIQMSYCNAITSTYGAASCTGSATETAVFAYIKDTCYTDSSTSYKITTCDATAIKKTTYTGKVCGAGASSSETAVKSAAACSSGSTPTKTVPTGPAAAVVCSTKGASALAASAVAA